MKTPKLISAVCIAIAIAAVTFTGCRKDNYTATPGISESDHADVINNYISEFSLNDAINVSHEGVILVTHSGSSLRGMNFILPNTVNEGLTSCAVITVNLRSTPPSATIDFGKGC